MVYCVKCGQQLREGTVICPSCGSAVPGQDMKKDSWSYGQTDIFAPEDVARNKWMAVFAYLGILVAVPLLAGRDSRFARYHANQGLTLFIAGVILNVVSWFFRGMSFLPFMGGIFGIYGIFRLLRLIIFILMIIGIVNAAKGEAKQLPLIGKIRLFRW